MNRDINEVPSATPEFRTELAEQLAQLAPDVIADGKIDVTKLTELLSEDAGEVNERFGLFWPGKKRALKAAQAPTTATLRPRPDLSKNWDTTQNVLIEGDNLEVLKIFQRHYHGKIKMIYIDPPYNTGQDFIYPDNYKEGLQSYLEFTKQLDESGKKLSTNSESEGRYHSNWLNMMYPRLKLARNLLANDGVIFISIDSHELAHLRRLCDEVFGERNFVNILSWVRTRTPAALSAKTKTIVEYVLCYERRRSSQPLLGLEKPVQSANTLLNQSNPTGELKFPSGIETSMSDRTLKPGYYGSKSYEVELLDEVHVTGGRFQESFRLRARFRWSQRYLEEQFAAGTRVRIATEKLLPSYEKDSYGREALPNLINEEVGVGTNESASADLEALLGGRFYTYPKPVSLLRYLVASCTNGDDLILDFFSGSGTTAHAVMEQNEADGEARRHIQVQLPEPIGEDEKAFEAGFRTVTEIARKRIEMAGDRIIDQLSGRLVSREKPLDVGYRMYELTDTNFAKWDAGSEVGPIELQEHLLDMRESADDQASQDDLLTELLLKQGLSLTEEVRSIGVDGLEVRSVGGGRLLAYLDEHTKPTFEQLQALVARGAAKVVILEDAFQGDDELKTNLAHMCESKNVELWTA